MFDNITPPPPPNRSIYHWKRASWSRMSHFFKTANWNFSGSVDAAVSEATDIITVATNKYVPSCTPRLRRPTPWWDCHCEKIWRRKLRYWDAGDYHNFKLTTWVASRIYNRAFKHYTDYLHQRLSHSTTDRTWWSLTKSLSGVTSQGKYSMPQPHLLSDYFASKLSLPPEAANREPVLSDVSHSLLTQFQIKKSKACRVLLNLDATKSVGDDLVSPRVLKFCHQHLCGPLTSLFRKICRSSSFPENLSWDTSL